MRINAVSGISQNKNNIYSNSRRNYDTRVDNNYTNHTELPSYQSISANLLLNQISFSGDVERKTLEQANKKYMDKLRKAEEKLKALKSPVKDEALAKAKADVAFCDDWDKNHYEYWSEAYDNNQDKLEKWRQEHSWWYRINHSEDKDWIRYESFADYNEKKEKYNDLKVHYEANKVKIEAASTRDAERPERIKDLESQIDNLKNLIDYGTLSKTINDSIAGHGGLDDRIAGYEAVKKPIRKFIASLSASKNGYDAYVPPCVILYGATGTGKSTFLKAVENMATDDVAVVRFDDNDKKDFRVRFKKACEDAQERYYIDNKRTILLMDDAEKYFCMSPGDAAYYKDELDESDWDRLKTINKNGTNQNVKEFKSILDVISQIPDESDDKKSAMTIFITTNHPNLIDRQLIKRTEKMDAYHVGPASGEDLNAVVKYYFEDKIRILEALKLFKDRPDMEMAISGMIQLDRDERESIISYFSQGKADKYNINLDEINFDDLTEEIQPSEEEGAYSNVMIKRISFNAFEKYLQNPENSYQAYFYSELENTKRDIEPQRYKRYLETAGFVNLYTQSQNINNIDDKDEFIKILNKRNKNLLKEDEKKLLERFLKSMNARLKTLKEKMKNGNISEAEREELKNLEEQSMYNNDAKKVKEYLKNNKSKK